MGEEKKTAGGDPGPSWLGLYVLLLALSAAAAVDTLHLRGEGEVDAELRNNVPTHKDVHFNIHSISDAGVNGDSANGIGARGGGGSDSDASSSSSTGRRSSRPPVLVLAGLQCLAVVLFLTFCVSPEEDGDSSSRSQSEVNVLVDSGCASGESALGVKAGSGASGNSSERNGAVRQRHAHGDGDGDDVDNSALHDDEKKAPSLFSSLRHSKRSLAVVCLLLVVTFFSVPTHLTTKRATVMHVFFYAWVTDLATGLGVIPFLFFHSVSKQYLGIANAVAAGMMSCASAQLFLEAIAADPCPECPLLLFSSPFTRCAAGVVLGFLFIIATKKVLDGHDDVHFGDLSGMDAKKVLLIMVVMTLHSFTEGVGIGVAFGGERGASVGFCIAVCLTIHNIPEGLAVALVLVPRGVSKLNATLWCVLTSLPQPLMAVPAFIFVESFLPVLPIGLGFASGAMLWVAFKELLTEAAGDVSTREIVIASTASFTSAYLLQYYFVE